MSDIERLVRNLNYDKIKEVVATHPSFFLNRLDGPLQDLVSVCYGYMNDELFKNPYSVLFRGMTYDTVKERIVHFPITKFYNINENEDTLLGTLPFDKLIGIYNKVDGVMNLLTIYNNEPLLRTKKRIIEDISHLPNGLVILAHWLGPRYTVVFEHIPLDFGKYNILTPSDKERFVVLRIIDNTTGISMDDYSLKVFTGMYDLECACNLKDKIIKNKEDALKIFNDEQRVEGYVLAFDNGTNIPDYVKLKTNWYVNMRYTNIPNASPKHLFKAWQDQTIDDMIAWLRNVGEDASHLELFQNNMVYLFNKFKKEIELKGKEISKMKPSEFHKLDKRNIINSLGIAFSRNKEINYDVSFAKYLRNIKFNFREALEVDYVKANSFINIKGLLPW